MTSNLRKSGAKVVIQEGAWYIVPLDNEDAALCLMARSTRHGTPLGYFFELPSERPSSAELERLEPRDALFVSQFGDASIVLGKWSLFSDALASWAREKWPVPRFLRANLLADRNSTTAMEWIVTYDDDCGDIISTEKVPLGKAPPDLPPETMDSPLGIELRLRELFGKGRGGNNGRDVNK